MVFFDVEEFFEEAEEEVVGGEEGGEGFGGTFYLAEEAVVPFDEGGVICKQKW